MARSRRKLTQKQTAGLLKAGIKKPKQYAALRAKGMSKARAAKITNSRKR